MDTKLDCEVDVEGTVDMMGRGEGECSPRSVSDTRDTTRMWALPRVLPRLPFLNQSPSGRFEGLDLSSTVHFSTVSCTASFSQVSGAPSECEWVAMGCLLCVIGDPRAPTERFGLGPSFIANSCMERFYDFTNLESKNLCDSMGRRGERQ